MHLDPVVVAKATVQLAAAHVDGNHRSGPVLEEAVGEAPGAGPDVHGPQPGWIQSKALEGRLQLPPAPPHVAGRRTGHHHRLPGRHQSGRLVGRRPVHGHPPGSDHLAGLGPTRHQPTPDHLQV